MSLSLGVNGALVAISYLDTRAGVIPRAMSPLYEVICILKQTVA